MFSYQTSLVMDGIQDTEILVGEEKGLYLDSGCDF